MLFLHLWRPLFQLHHSSVQDTVDFRTTSWEKCCDLWVSWEWSNQLLHEVEQTLNHKRLALETKKNKASWKQVTLSKCLILLCCISLPATRLAAWDVPSAWLSTAKQNSIGGNLWVSWFANTTASHRVNTCFCVPIISPRQLPGCHPDSGQMCCSSYLASFIHT